ncbi:nicotinamide-nucleotide amidohydrolase family protein [candidate division WOR-3 bacterium]|nr:nicotinamide-nucleotide amidohydrolase family protein [candidate division WOR-3 bacterium]
MRIEEEVGKILKEKELTIAVVESCTGGLIQKLITDIPGSSDYFLGGVVAYSNELKQKLVQVSAATLKEYGAVSSEVACELANGIRKVTGATLGLSTTGIAGPGGGTREKPVGLVYIGLSSASGGKNILRSERFLFKGNRFEIREKAAHKALELIKFTLTNRNEEILSD